MSTTIRVLGCSGAIARGARTTSFLIDECVLVDAGTGVGDLPLEAMAAVDHVLLTHTHLDHVAALPLMLDTVAGLRHGPLHVHALPETIEALRKHIFNGLIWPDFSVIPSADKPLLRFVPIEVGQKFRVGGVRLEVMPAAHSVPAVGYAVHTPQGQWVFTGDTALCPAFWERFNRLKVAMLVIETAFSQREERLAALSHHLCPSTLAEALENIRYPEGSQFPIGITHTKPAESRLIQFEIRGMGLHRQHQLRWLRAGQVFRF